MPVPARSPSDQSWAVYTRLQLYLNGCHVVRAQNGKRCQIVHCFEPLLQLQ